MCAYFSLPESYFPSTKYLRFSESYLYGYTSVANSTNLPISLSTVSAKVIGQTACILVVFLILPFLSGFSVLPTLSFALRRLTRPPLRPADTAASWSHLWAVPNRCASLPPIADISRRRSGVNDANPCPFPRLFPDFPCIAKIVQPPPMIKVSRVVPAERKPFLV